MSIELSLAIFIVSVAILLFSAELLVSVAIALSNRFKISPLITGLIIVSLGTTLPELTVSVLGIVNHQIDLALGNLLGSNITNACLIFGLAIVLKSPRIGNHKTPRNSLLLLTLTLVYVVLSISSLPFTVRGLILIISGLAIIAIQWLWAKAGQKHEDKNVLKKLEKSYKKHFLHHRPIGQLIIYVTAAILGLSSGGFLATKSLSAIALSTGLSGGVLGLTILAVATSLPELITIIVSSINKQDKIVMGTVIGSSLYNLGFFAGLVTYFQKEQFVTYTELIILMLSALLVAWIVHWYQGKNIPRFIGLLLLGLYVVFIIEAF